MRGDRRERKAMLCQCQKRRCGKRGGSQRLRTATFAASFFSDRGRSGTMGGHNGRADANRRSEEHTSELQSLMRISYAVFCLKKKKKNTHTINVILRSDPKHKQ